MSLFKDLLKQLNAFLKPHRITTSCDIFEETLLKEAGINTQPSKCQFGKESKTQLYFKIRGISEEEAETFLNFLKKTTGDEEASKTFIPERNLSDSSSNSTDSSSSSDSDYDFLFELDNVHHFIIDQSKANETLLPLIKMKFDSISPKKIAEYVDKCEDDDRLEEDSELEINSEDSEQFAKTPCEKLNHELDAFLIPLSISNKFSNIFIETTLKLAGIEDVAKKSKFGSSDNGKMVLSIKGLDSDDTNKLHTFFKETLGDTDATIVCFPQDKENDFSNKKLFIINTEMVTNKLLKLFTDDITEISKKSPKKLDIYKKLSEKDDAIKVYQCTVLMDDIMKKAVAITSSNLSDYTRGQLNIIIGKILDPALEKFKKNIVKNNEKLINADVQIDQALSLLDDISEENKELKDNKKMEYLQGSLRLYSMFRASIVNAATSKEIDYDNDNIKNNYKQM